MYTSLSLAWEMPRARPITLLSKFLGCGNSFNKSLESKKEKKKNKNNRRAKCLTVLVQSCSKTCPNTCFGSINVSRATNRAAGRSSEVHLQRLQASAEQYAGVQSLLSTKHEIIQHCWTFWKCSITNTSPETQRLLFPSFQSMNLKLPVKSAVLTV